MIKCLPGTLFLWLVACDLCSEWRVYLVYIMPRMLRVYCWLVYLVWLVYRVKRPSFFSPY